MALSGFIKQLLETDTVFGSEAKKSTGINDASIRAFYPGVDISFIVDAAANTLDFIINDYTEDTVPDWLIIDKYIKIDFIPLVENDASHIPLIQYEEKLFQISSVIHDQTLNTLTLSFNPDAVGTPMFSLLTTVLNVTGISLLIDGRIFKLIGDPDIAREASNGSTMFNLDNTVSTPFQEADASGIASKYAAHYHTDLVSDFVAHELDDNGNPLVRVAIDSLGLTQTVEFFEDTALERGSRREVTGANTNVSFSDGSTSTQLARYGTPATVLQGILVQLDQGQLPLALDDDPGLSEADAVLLFNGSGGTDGDGLGFIWDYKNPTSQLRTWPNPGPIGDRDASQTCMEALASEFNTFGPLNFTYEYAGIIGGRHTITYQGTIAGPGNNFYPQIFNNGGAGTRLHYFRADTQDGAAALPLTGNQFFTTQQLLTLLSANTYGINIVEDLDVFTFSTTVDGERIVNINAPSSGDPVFVNAEANRGLFDLPLSISAFKVQDAPPDLVYDLEGDPVFGVPAFSVRRL